MSTKYCRVRHLPGRCLIINVQGGMDEDVKTRIGKAKRAFLQLQTIWKSRELPQRTKTRISNSNIKSVLLYGDEAWRITRATVTKVQTFINICLRGILRVHWPEKINNISLWDSRSEREMKRRKQSRIWHQYHETSTVLEPPRDRKGEEAGREKPGAETSWQTPRGWASPGTNQKQRHRTEGL